MSRYLWWGTKHLSKSDYVRHGPTSPSADHGQHQALATAMGDDVASIGYRRRVGACAQIEHSTFLTPWACQYGDHPFHESEILDTNWRICSALDTR